MDKRLLDSAARSIDKRGCSFTPCPSCRQGSLKLSAGSAKKIGHTLSKRPVYQYSIQCNACSAQLLVTREPEKTHLEELVI